MADPDPVVKLPNTEWIEIKNNSSFNINLKDWKVAKPSLSSAPIKDYILNPDEFVILCSSSAASSMSAYGNPQMTHKGVNQMTNTLAYIEGRNSAHALYTGGNPYRMDTQQRADWQRGRADGQAALGLKPVDWAALRAELLAEAA